MQELNIVKRLCMWWKVKDENFTNALQVMPWVPQNDILGHNHTRVFLSHMGANSLYEVSFC